MKTVLLTFLALVAAPNIMADDKEKIIEVPVEKMVESFVETPVEKVVENKIELVVFVLNVLMELTKYTGVIKQIVSLTLNVNLLVNAMDLNQIQKKLMN